ncbi:Hsp20/alpha crystallin family protein [Rathayibacter rathayi]|uniref:Hsp20/alpha crystallin family protein n=1 Tax=Rathayibacter rathayi TaxID=33887 RepID=A0ABD6W7Z2_RATRA|nr:Hsp20/alpha crystallin family protein [Rathayibacter rathayi]AZZ48176.1 Hsp20/alpha crystallin family protein [Rathayibacter rathayi]MWV75456.1 Hsp20 family protein [Rathayibacter rathayi NCPPB 2980 = VKM Ac-1601]PPF13706.1 Hsp20/alpha crystallin family protein [Rathayibacter rathayi]PPF48382.1 Hsp20/alpha crystallin family protein [Rathayibacter rathayi]PPF82120.1 Hsp20/alpha crystallin family protein [Rathayibacter rathayi]
MAVTYDPARELDRLAAAVLGSGQGPRRMPIDLYRDGDHYVLTADLPGIDPGSVDVDVDGQLLTIRAQRTVTSSDDLTWITRERQSATFVRQLSLGQGVDTERIAASYDNGVLAVTIPVSEKARPRRIEVVSNARPEQVRIGEASAE